MSLKVLLADDSAAIKKVVQLSLQDYGVTLKTVGSGKDVLDVAKSFQPDIVFVDVLLPQKTGYDVASELKKDPDLSKTPVIMLWSSFMSFDEGKYSASGADDKLEKPFEVAGLRSLVNKYVAKTATSAIAKHFEFPNLYFDAQKAPTITTENPEPLIPAMEPVPIEVVKAPAENWSMSSFEDVNQFMTNPSTPNVVPEAAEESSNIWSGDSEWIRKDLGKFTVPVPEENIEVSDEAIATQYTNTNINLKDFLLKPHVTPGEAPKSEEVTAPTIPTNSTNPTTAPTATNSAEAPPRNERLENEIRAQAKEIIEKVVWKLVPDIASNIIKEELTRLLGDEK
jgi:CheY-like chemotaxis protein